MARKYDSHTHMEDVTQAEISDAIRYLDPDLRSGTEHEGYGTGVVICVILMILVFVSLVLLWLYP